ncbi:MAG TPA: endonuclease NucS domain-containing protein [Streptosporangiaceae bacterium]|nr:endonuclease NucS domain-containing protein [Streptosporangiaceae bacterium]
MTALFVRQPDKTMLPFDAAAAAIADADEDIDDLDQDGAAAEGGWQGSRLRSSFSRLIWRSSSPGNWASISWVRPLEIWVGAGGQSGHQLSTPVGRLDFLCVDRQAGALVVVELKRGRSSDKVVGQVARYIGYVGTHIAQPGQAVEGLIVAHDADDALRYAVAAFPGLRVMTYEIAFQLRSVAGPA